MQFVDSFSLILIYRNGYWYTIVEIDFCCQRQFYDCKLRQALFLLFHHVSFRPCLVDREHKHVDLYSSHFGGLDQPVDLIYAIIA